MRKLSLVIMMFALISSASASAALHFQTVAQRGTFQAVPPFKQPRGYIASDRKATLAFSQWLIPNDRARVRAVNYRRYVAVGVIYPISSSAWFKVTSLARAGATLTVFGELHVPSTGLPAFGTVYHIVKVPRSAFGRTLPRRVIVNSAKVRDG